MTEKTDVEAELRRLPKINRVLADAYTEMLQERSGSLKRPELAGRLYTLVEQLHELGQPIPPREVLAQAIGGAKSKFTVDTIIYQGRANGDFTLVVESTDGKTKNRSGIRQERYLVPSKRMKFIAKTALKRA